MPAVMYGETDYAVTSENKSNRRVVKCLRFSILLDRAGVFRHIRQSHSIIQRLLPSAEAMSKSTENTGSTVRYGRLPVFVFEEVIGCLPKHCGRAENFSPRGRFGGCGYRRSSGVSEFSAVSEGAVSAESAFSFAFEISPSDSSPPFCGSSSLCGASATLATLCPRRFSSVERPAYCGK